MKNFILPIMVLVVGFGMWWSYQSRQPKVLKVDLPQAKQYENFDSKNIDLEEVVDNLAEEPTVVKQQIIDQVKQEPVEQVATNTNSQIKSINNINLAVPFTSQAPTANWDQPFQDACEEASLLMAVYYYENKEMPAAREVEKILYDMVAWQDQFMKGTYDITIEETAQLAQGYFGYNTKIVPDLNIDKIRNLLIEGIPIIIPANGHILANPYFRGDGPDYHMLVVKGFVGDKFITNDPGTKHGADFIYTEKNLVDAIANWNVKEALAAGPKTGLILYKD